MVRRSRSAAALAVALVVAATGLSFAVRVRLTDPDDTPGVLDVREVRFAHPKGEPPSWTVITARDWTIGSLWDRGYVFVQLDARGAPKADHYALVRSDGLRLRADLFRVTRGGVPDVHVRVLTVWRKANDSVSVKVPLKALRFGPARTSYRWWIVTSITSDRCPRGCLDRVPDEGSVEQMRPGTSPSPSISPTPSVTPSPTPSVVGAAGAG